MASTVWSTMIRTQPRSWLLGNGEIVSEPALEESGSGRKTRIAGTTESVFHFDTEKMLFENAKALARRKKTHVHLELTRPLNAIIARVATYEPAETQALLHLVHAPNETVGRFTFGSAGKTIAWWRFKDSKTPFEVLLTAMMFTEGQRLKDAGVQKIKVYLTVPTRTYVVEPSNGDDTVAVNIDDAGFESLIDQVDWVENDWREFIRSNPVDWDTDLLGEQNHPHLRTGVKALLKIVRELDSMESIQVPDFGDPDNPSYRTLPLHDTNYNEALANDLAEYLDNAATIEQAAEHYRQMLATLHDCGMVFDDASDNDFMAVLQAGDKAALGVRVFNLAETEHRLDGDHKLSIHLPTGTFIVECSHKQVDPDEVAQQWEEALTIAALTGQENALLAYARARAEDYARERSQTIIEERSP